MKEKKFEQEIRRKALPGMLMLLVITVILLASVAVVVGGIVKGVQNDSVAIGVTVPVVGTIVFVIACIMYGGLKIIRPNEALVLTLFGNYYGTLYDAGFFWVNPFCNAVNPAAGKGRAPAQPADGVKSVAAVNLNLGSTSFVRKTVSLKAMTLDNKKQKVNDQMGNPVEIGTIVIWKVVNATKAVFNVENYSEFLSIQCDAITRNAARNYPYDVNEGSDEKTLRGSSQEIADIMQEELQKKVEEAGIEVLDVRITHLAYAPEIASAMLQRQQASAIIDARQKIVEGAVSMVEMALKQLSENEIVELDEERKAAMVSNLLVVLCGNKDAQPIVNSGSIY